MIVSVFACWNSRGDVDVGSAVLEKEVEEGNDTVTKYVRIFGVKSFIAASFALLVVYGLF